MSLCLVAIFKNESHIMKEWLNHYISQGVDKFLLIDNDSNDNYFEILSPYIDRNMVYLRTDERKHSQVICYNDHFLEECKKYDWVIVCDLDEFIYARKGFKNIKEYLNSVNPSVSQVLIPWKLFGSNGFDTIEKEQPTSVIEGFTKRTNYDKKDNFQGILISDEDKYSLDKSIVRTNRLIKFSVHCHETTDNNFITSDNNPHSMHGFAKISEKILDESFLHLNHYAIQSFKWFSEVKVNRGDVNDDKYENMRDQNYFESYDNSSSDIFDLELYHIRP